MNTKNAVSFYFIISYQKNPYYITEQQRRLGFFVISF